MHGSITCDLLIMYNCCSRMIWLGDLNYRMALSYEETRVLLEDNDWDTLLEKDQVCCSGPF